MHSSQPTTRRPRHSLDQEEGLPAAVQKSPYHPAVIPGTSRLLPIFTYSRPTKKHFARFWLLFPKPLIVQFCLRIRSVHRPSETNMVNGDNGAERALVGRKQGNESAGLLLGTPDAECEAGAWGPRQPSSVSGDGELSRVNASTHRIRMPSRLRINVTFGARSSH